MSGKPVARQSDPTSCPLPGHGTNSVATGSPDVIFDGLPAARMSDKTACGGAISGAVSSTVLINGMPAALMGSTTNHGGVIIGGSGTVIIGDTVASSLAAQPSNFSPAATAQPMAPVREAPTPALDMASHLAAPTQAAGPTTLPPDALTAATQILSDFQNRPSTTRVFNDPANPMGTPTDPFEKHKIVEQLRVRVARAHGQTMTSSTFISNYPHQAATSLCGPAAFFYALLMDRPDLYTQAITELWETGQTTIGSLRIKPSYGCRNPENMSYRREGDRVLAIDWISLASLRDSENSLMDYDSPDDQAAGVTPPWAIESWFTRAGAVEVFSNIQLSSISLPSFLELLSYVGSQHHVVSLVSASMLEGGVGVGKNHWIVWEDIPGTHTGAIAVSTSSNEQITDSRLFSWGNLGHQVTHGLTVRQLLSDVFGGKVFGRIP